MGRKRGVVAELESEVRYCHDATGYLERGSKAMEQTVKIVEELEKNEEELEEEISNLKNKIEKLEEENKNKMGKLEEENKKLRNEFEGKMSNELKEHMKGRIDFNKVCPDISEDEDCKDEAFVNAADNVVGKKGAEAIQEYLKKACKETEDDEILEIFIEELKEQNEETLKIKADNDQGERDLQEEREREICNDLNSNY